jgi:hypothetical protein
LRARLVILTIAFIGLGCEAETVALESGRELGIELGARSYREQAFDPLEAGDDFSFRVSPEGGDLVSHGSLRAFGIDGGDWVDGTIVACALSAGARALSSFDRAQTMRRDADGFYRTSVEFSVPDMQGLDGLLVDVECRARRAEGAAASARVDGVVFVTQRP